MTNIYHRRSIALVGEARQSMLADFMHDIGVGHVRAVRATVETMLAEELALLGKREAQQRQTQRLFAATLAGTGVLILIVAAATLLLIRRNLADLRKSRADLSSLNEHLEDEVDARTGELQRANGEI